MSDNLAILAIVAIAALMLRTWWLHREKMKGLSISKQALSPSDDRLARVEQAVESIAIEVERIGEGQRFVTKLMSERAQPMRDGVAIPAARRKMDTPH
jgi:hypothetical protein